MPENTERSCIFMLAICYHARGDFKRAYDTYEGLMRVDPSHMGIAQMDWAAYMR
jgi:cytochrome c-type biogenesis protein CcmH/NrfG